MMQLFQEYCTILNPIKCKSYLILILSSTILIVVLCVDYRLKELCKVYMVIIITYPCHLKLQLTSGEFEVYYCSLFSIRNCFLFQHMLALLHKTFMIWVIEDLASSVKNEHSQNFCSYPSTYPP